MKQIGEYLGSQESPRNNETTTLRTLTQKIDFWRQEPCPHCGKPLPTEPPRVCDCKGATQERVRWDAQLRRVKEVRVRELIERRRQEAGLVGRLRRMTFENFDASLQPEAYQKAKEFTGEKGENLVLYGAGFGTGKTHLGAAILNRHIDQAGRGRFCETTELFGRLWDTYSSDAKESEGRVLNEVREAPLLILDDVGRTKCSDPEKERLYRIINYRWLRGLPTVITTNYNKPSKLGDAIGEACLSRLTEGVSLVHLEGEDYRLRRVKG